MTTAIVSNTLRRTTGGLLVAGALSFAAAATVLSSTFDWPDVLREPADVVLPSFVAGGTTNTHRRKPISESITEAAPT